MKIAIIGAGNMGGAIARGIAGKPEKDIRVVVANPTWAKLEKLATEYPSVEVTTENVVAVKDADIVVIAVKPWIFETVADEIKASASNAAIVSVAAGVTIEQMARIFGSNARLFRVIPNTAIMRNQGMTFVAHSESCGEDTVTAILDIFDALGRTAIIKESMMGAATALASCGIAYVYKYIQASVQAGVELGFTPAKALEYTIQTVAGAVAMMNAEGATPQTEIDRVTTPGGMTIKGVNELEKTGFTASVISAIKKPIE